MKDLAVSRLHEILPNDKTRGKRERFPLPKKTSPTRSVSNIRNYYDRKIRNRYRLRDSYAASYKNKSVLRVRKSLRRNARYAGLSGVSGTSGCYAAREQGLRGTWGGCGACAQLRYCSVYQIRPQALFLSRPCQRLPNHAVRFAALHGRLCRFALAQLS